jgi:hypothetical protein
MIYLKTYEGFRPNALNQVDIEDVKVGDYFIHEENRVKKQILRIYKTNNEREEIFRYVVKITKLYKDDENFSLHQHLMQYRNSVQFNAICIWPNHLRGFTMVSNDNVNTLQKATPEEIEEYELLDTTNKYNL